MLRLLLLRKHRMESEWNECTATDTVSINSELLVGIFMFV